MASRSCNTWIDFRPDNGAASCFVLCLDSGRTKKDCLISHHSFCKRQAFKHAEKVTGVFTKVQQRVQARGRARAE
eukprot:6206124-Pleurochrysis_carterae.AAC.1